MSEETRQFANWEEVIVDFFEHRIAKSELAKARKYIVDKAVNIEKEKDVKKLEKLKEAKNKKQQELRQLRKDAPATEIRVWIDENHKKVATEKTIRATHVLRFTHSSSNPDGLLLKEKADDLLLSTASVKRKLTLDLAHKNGAHISISRFLSLQLSEEMIFDLILVDDFKFLEPFKENEEQLNKWKEGFKKLVEAATSRLTADKSKQLYFPLDNNLKNYHLITPLFASSLCNEIDSIINNLKYKEQKEVNKYRNHTKSPKYYETLYIDYPNLAIQNFGGEHAKNVSMLNANRSGKAYLFSNQPPIWQSQIKAPIYKKSLFDYFGNNHITEDINYLRDFLLRFENIGLSIKDPKRYEYLKRWVDSIIDEVLFYTSSIQHSPSGWTTEKGIKLKVEHQYFLDPYRDDEVFQMERETTDWQGIVCSDFARWLNSKLKGQDNKFTPQAEHTRIWKGLFEIPLREDSEAIKADIKYKQQKGTA